MYSADEGFVGDSEDMITCERHWRQYRRVSGVGRAGAGTGGGGIPICILLAYVSQQCLAWGGSNRGSTVYCPRPCASGGKKTVLRLPFSEICPLQQCLEENGPIRLPGFLFSQPQPTHSQSSLHTGASCLSRSYSCQKSLNSKPQFRFFGGGCAIVQGCQKSLF